MDARVVIVSYDSRRHLPGLLDSLRCQHGVSYETLLVDNASSDGSADFAEAACPEATVVRNDANLGFAAATNIGLRAGATGGHRYALLLNPDVVLSPGVLSGLTEFMDAHPDVGAAGCTLLDADGRLQHSIGRFPTLANQVGQNLLLNRLLPWLPMLCELDLRDESYAHAHDVDWLFGAVLIVRRAALDQVGLLDERFFLFSEEEDLCLRLRRAGWRVMYTPEVVATHLGRGMETRPDVYWLLVRSKLLFAEKQYGRGVALALRWLMAAGMALRAALWSVPALLHVKKDAPAFVRTYGSGLRRLVAERGAR